MTNEALTFISLCNQYCSTLESLSIGTTRRDFVAEMLRLLPRLYASAFDLPFEVSESDGPEAYLDEATYAGLQNKVSVLLGADDTYLEVFEEDMKYSDTPIAVSISENLSDLYQVFYNLIETVRDAPDIIVEETIAAVKEDFTTYWSQILCNVMRALNYLYTTQSESDE